MDAKKRRPVAGRLSVKSWVYRSGAAGTRGAAAGAAGPKVEGTIQLEAVHVEVHLDRFGFFQELRVDDEFETVDGNLGVSIGRLIQSHGKAGAPSPAFVEKNSDGFDFLPLEIFGNLFNCRWCDLKHVTLLEIEMSASCLFRASGVQLVSAMKLTPSIGFVNPNCMYVPTPAWRTDIGCKPSDPPSKIA
jgi:hypothetical protein